MSAHFILMELQALQHAPPLDLNRSSAAKGEDNTETFSADSKLVIFVAYGCILPIIATFGVVGNTLTLIVLWRREFNFAAIIFLRVMAVTDSLMVTVSTAILTPLSWAKYSDTKTTFDSKTTRILLAIVEYVIMSLHMVNIWTTVMISLERFVTICHPFHTRFKITMRKAKVAVISIVIFACVYNIPHLFSNKPTFCVLEFRALHKACTEKNSQFFIIFSKYLMLITYGMLPISALIYFNVRLIIQLKKLRQELNSFTHAQCAEADERDMIDLSMSCVGVVVLFLICSTPSVILQFDITLRKNSNFVFVVVSHLLVIANSCFTVLVYTAFGKRFRRGLWKVLRRMKRIRHTFSTTPSIRSTNSSIRQHIRERLSTPAGRSQVSPEVVESAVDVNPTNNSYSYNYGYSAKIQNFIVGLTNDVMAIGWNSDQSSGSKEKEKEEVKRSSKESDYDKFL